MSRKKTKNKYQSAVCRLQNRMRSVTIVEQRNVTLVANPPAKPSEQVACKLQHSRNTEPRRKEKQGKYPVSNNFCSR